MASTTCPDLQSIVSFQPAKQLELQRPQPRPMLLPVDTDTVDIIESRVMKRLFK
jgi:hypothetical protein